jgi:hypothetical protein
MKKNVIVFFTNGEQTLMQVDRTYRRRSQLAIVLLWTIVFIQAYLLKIKEFIELPTPHIPNIRHFT